MGQRRAKPTKGPNYLRSLLAMREMGVMTRGGVEHITVQHDDWCDQLSGRGWCNCDPDIKFGPPA